MSLKNSNRVGSYIDFQKWLKNIKSFHTLVGPVTVDNMIDFFQDMNSNCFQVF